MEKRVCGLCEETLDLTSFYNDERFYCIPCERYSARSRMRRYGRTLRGKAANALQTSRKTIRKNRYEVVDDLTLMDVIWVMATSEGCDYCGNVTNELQIDHIIPLSKGGGNTISNITLACAHENRSKHNRALLDWREYDDVAHVIEKVASRRGVSVAQVLEEFTP
jgi:5-methylcytosine-specific restriction endonuclease McrA